MRRIATLILISALAFISETEAHGRLMVPPARGTAWRENPNMFPA